MVLPDKDKTVVLDYVEKLTTSGFPSPQKMPIKQRKIGVVNLFEKNEEAGCTVQIARTQEQEKGIGKTGPGNECVHLKNEGEVQAAPTTALSYQKQKQSQQRAVRSASNNGAPESVKGKLEGVGHKDTNKTKEDGVKTKVQPEAEAGSTRDKDSREVSTLGADVGVDATSETCAELSQWKKLLDGGTISQKEFEEQKRKTLRKHDVKKLRTELGEWLRCGSEVLNKENRNELEKFYLKVAKRSIKIEGGYEEALDFHEEIKTKLRQQIDSVLLIAQSKCVKKNMDHKPHRQLAVLGGESRVQEPTTSKRPLSEAGAYDKVGAVHKAGVPPETKKGKLDHPVVSSSATRKTSNLLAKDTNKRELGNKRKDGGKSNLHVTWNSGQLDSPFHTTTSTSSDDDLSERKKKKGPRQSAETSKCKEVRGRNSEETCLKFISKVKNRFPNKPHMIKDITNLVEKIQVGDKSVVEKEINNLFAGHPDLLNEFNQFSNHMNVAVSGSPGTRTSPRKSGKKEFGRDMIGRRLKVWWGGDEKYYAGFVRDFNSKSGKHKIVYDDKEVEWKDLSEEKIKWVSCQF